MNSVKTIIQAIFYVLWPSFPFRSGFLYHIGIITYISVLERTKEIGYPGIGASKGIAASSTRKRFSIGFERLLLGIGLTLLLTVPVN
jgi:putative ABC transport system permease protein